MIIFAGDGMLDAGHPAVTPGWSVLLWFVGLLLAVGGCTTAFLPAGKITIQRKWLALLLLVVSAVTVFRYAGLEKLPWGPEGILRMGGKYYLAAMEMSFKGTVPIFNEGTGIFLLYYWAVSAWIFQVTPGLFIKVLPVLGIISLLACTAWAATIFQSRISVLAFALLLGFSVCDAIYFNRTQQYSHSTLFLAMVLLCLTLAVEKNRPRAFGWAGFFTGIGLLTSYLFLAVISLPFIYLVVEGLRQEKKTTYFRRGFAIFLFCAILASTPFIVSCMLDSYFTLNRLTSGSLIKSPEIPTQTSEPTPLRFIKSLHEAVLLYVTGQGENKELDVMGELTPLHYWLLPFVIPGLWLALKKLRRGNFAVLVLWALLPIAICILNRPINIRLFAATPALYVLAVLPCDRLAASSRNRLACLSFVVLAAGTCYQAVHTLDVNFFEEKNLIGLNPRDAAGLRAVNNLVVSETEVPFYFTFNCGGPCFDNPYVVKRKLMETMPETVDWVRPENGGSCGDRETRESAFQVIVGAIRADTEKQAEHKGERFSLVFRNPDPCAEEILLMFSIFARPIAERLYHGVSRMTGAQNSLRVVELEIIAPLPLLDDPDDANRSDAS